MSSKIWNHLNGFITKVIVAGKFTGELAKQKQIVLQQISEINFDWQNKLNKKQQQIFVSCLTLSDYALRCFKQYPELITSTFADPQLLEAKIVDYSSLLKKHLAECENEAQLMAIIRQFRHQHCVAILAADMVLQQPISLTLSRQTLLAEALIEQTLNWQYRQAILKWGEPQNHAGEAMPMLVYGMGKLGGGELNFSSDIDLIFSYPESGQTHGARRSLDNQQFFTRLAQALINALAKTTQDGFVYRVDMRLRPFGESGPLVINFNAMEDYYQDQGRDWERYAMLKARLIGESSYHGQLSAMLRPFVYRRYIDFSVIESLRRMKLLIAQEVRRKNLTDNIKLAAGGIRELEFMVQVFQLLRGGRQTELQKRNFLEAVAALQKNHVISHETAHIFTTAYLFLRKVENALQAFDDQQTQTLPDDELNKARLLAVLQIDTWPQFKQQLAQIMAQVHHEFKLLIGEDSQIENDEAEFGLELWQSKWQVAELANWLHSQSSWQADVIFHQLSRLKEQISKRSIGHRGQQILDKLMPRLLNQLQQHHHSEQTVARVMKVVSEILTRTTYLELLFENRGALLHLIKLCQQSGWIAEYLAKYPILLDELLDPALLSRPPALSSYQDELTQMLLRIDEQDLEQQMDVLRQFKHAQHLRIAAADICGVLPLTQVSDHLTAVAEAIIHRVVHMAWQQVTKRYGEPLSCVQNDHYQFLVIGYGKLGGIELGYGSDLDLVFIHNCDLNELTNGDKSVTAGQFFAKLAQRMMHIFNTNMNSGILYELDMRLRPSGNSGVLVVNINTFANYQQHEAWTWEHQALVRARPIFGESELKQQFSEIRQQVLAKTRDEQQLKHQIVEMRNKMQNHLDKSTEEKIDIKYCAGGLVDIEFICQYLVLAYAAQFNNISQFSDNFGILQQASRLHILTQEQAGVLSHTYCQLRDLGHRQVLQQVDDKLVDKNELPDLSQVRQIWQQLLG